MPTQDINKDPRFPPFYIHQFVDRLSAARSTLVRKNADKRCALSAFSLYPVDDGAAAPNPAGIET
jgi:hypothetical protein